MIPCPKCKSVSTEFRNRTLIDGLTYLKERVLHCLICGLDLSEAMIKNRRNPPAIPKNRNWHLCHITEKEKETLKNL